MDRDASPAPSSHSPSDVSTPASQARSDSSDSADPHAAVSDVSSPSGTEDGRDDLSLDDDDDRLLSYDPTPAHNPYPAPKWFSVQELQAREIGCQVVSNLWLVVMFVVTCSGSMKVTNVKAAVTPLITEKRKTGNQSPLQGHA